MATDAQGRELCTTNKKPVEEVLAGQTNATGQHDGYIVLCEAERQNGATFCCGCNGHFPVAEFVWTADGKRVGG